MASSSTILLTGVMVPLCMTVTWVVYKYRSWKVKKMIVDLKTQQALRRYVLLESVHGNPESVLLTYKEYSRQDHQIEGLIFTPEQDIFFADAVKKAAPLTVLTLGTQCGYSAIRLLSFLPPNGKLYAVEQDEDMAESAEEMILMSGFKNPQFKLLAQHPVEAINIMKEQFGMEKVDLVLMDLNPSQYHQCLQALEEDRVVHPGMLLLANNMEEPGAKEFMDHLQNNPRYIFLASCQGLMMVHCVGTR